ncbi:MAG: nitroreductase family protein [Armatimonadetes bacterium]|nr:nitroreductase family protein [Armatimonadota bacterium]
MDTLTTIMTRRSVRQYTGEPVDPALIEQLLRAAMAAPSAGNQQPWHFVVVTERAKLDAVPEFHRHAWMSANAPLAILICADISHARYPDLWPQDCSAATQNLLLAAHALGLGAVWTGVYPKEDIMKGLRDLCLLPDDVIPFSLIVIGHPVEPAPTEDRYDAARVHDNTW